MSTPEWVADRVGEQYMVIMGFVGVRKKVAKLTRLVVSEVHGELIKVVEMCFKLEHVVQVSSELLDCERAVGGPLLGGGKAVGVVQLNEKGEGQT